MSIQALLGQPSAHCWVPIPGMFFAHCMPWAGHCRVQLIPGKEAHEMLVCFLWLLAFYHLMFPGQLGHMEETPKEHSWQ